MTPLERAAVDYINAKRTYDSTRHAFRFKGPDQDLARAWRRLIAAMDAALERMGEP